MKKVAIVGIIIAAAIVIGVISALSYRNNTSDITTEETVTTGDTVSTTTEGAVETQGKNLTVELSESVGIKSNP